MANMAKKAKLIERLAEMEETLRLALQKERIPAVEMEIEDATFRIASLKKEIVRL